MSYTHKSTYRIEERTEVGVLEGENLTNRGEERGVNGVVSNANETGRPVQLSKNLLVAKDTKCSTFLSYFNEQVP